MAHGGVGRKLGLLDIDQNLLKDPVIISQLSVLSMSDTENMKQAGKKKLKDGEQQNKDLKGANTAKQSQPDTETSKLTLSDIERLLTSTEERIVNKLSANQAIIEEHHKSIQQLETSVTCTGKTGNT